VNKRGATSGLSDIVRGNLPAHALIQFPSGRWGFVGNTDSRLAFTMKDGSEVTKDAAKTAASFGPALAGVKTRSWTTREEAVEAAEALGFKVS
jgi:hypothetical protein